MVVARVVVVVRGLRVFVGSVVEGWGRLVRLGSGSGSGWGIEEVDGRVHAVVVVPCTASLSPPSNNNTPGETSGVGSPVHTLTSPPQRRVGAASLAAPHRRQISVSP